MGVHTISQIQFNNFLYKNFIDIEMRDLYYVT